MGASTLSTCVLTSTDCPALGAIVIVEITLPLVIVPPPVMINSWPSKGLGGK